MLEMYGNMNASLYALSLPSVIGESLVVVVTVLTSEFGSIGRGAGLAACYSQQKTEEC